MSEKQKLYCKTLGCKMAYAVKGIIRQLGHRFCEENIALTIEQYFILNILDNEEGLILKELADIVGRDKSAVLRHIDGLQKNHFVARATDPADKRRKILLVTKQGMNVLEKARVLDHEVNDKIMGHIKSEKRQELKDLITKIYEYSISEEYC